MRRPSGFPLIFAALLAGAALLAAPTAFAAPTTGAKANPPGRAGPGCDPSRPAVAHRPGGFPLARQPANQPIPCQTVVGPTTESADVGVTRSRAVLYAPLNENTAPPPQNVLDGPEHVVRSNDRGSTWTLLDSGGPTTGGLVPPWMSVDPQTSRIWFATTLPTLCGARISWSDDDGESWRTNPSVGCPAQGANKLLEGPPPDSGAQPVGYPHVVYYCANGEDVGESNVYCYRSLDGGRTFDFAGIPDPPLPSGCTERHPARTGVVGPDGALYFPTQVCGVLGIAISRDEGETWTQRTIARTEIEDIYIASIAVDARGNLYIAWIGPGGLPHLTISRDRGRTWREPRRVVAPDVKQVRRVAITAGRRGQVALAYQGTPDGSGFNGYITGTANALANRPLYWSATVNDPAQPLVNAADTQTFGDRFFYGTNVIAPDGNVWAGFHCAKTAACAGQRLGVVGRLAPSSNRFGFTKLRRRKRNGTATLTVEVPGPGRVVLARNRKVGRVAKQPRDAGKVRLRVRPRGTARRRLSAERVRASGKKRARVRVRARVTYTPTAGEPRTKARRLRLVRRR